MVEECWKKKRRQDKIILIRMEEIIKQITKWIKHVKKSVRIIYSVVSLHGRKIISGEIYIEKI